MSTHLDTQVFLGLGGNLGEPLDAFRRSREQLSSHPQVSGCRSSALYRTPPLGGPAGQPDYLNAALMLSTRLEPRALLTLCQGIESAAGRQRDIHWGPRTLDIDLLLYGRQGIDEPGLQVPHPRLLERQFVLLPLLDLDPELCHPLSGLPLAAALKRLPPADDISLLAAKW